MKEKSKHQKAFEGFAERAKKELGDSLEKLMLYGSVARGEGGEESDVDVFAVVRKRSQKKQLQDLAFEVGLKYGVSFSPIVKTVDEYRKMKDSLYGREVRSTGEAMICLM